MRRPTVGRGRQASVTPNILIAHLEKIAPTPVVLREPSPPLASMNNQLMLKELKCAVCSNILSQPLELLCGALVCTKCLQEWIAASGTEGGPLVSSHVRPAPGVILLAAIGCFGTFVQTAAGMLRLVTMKGMNVYHHLHLRRRSKQKDC